MVLMKKQDRDQLVQLRAQCGQERDMQIKQVEGGYVIQVTTRFFVDQDGPIQVGEVSDVTVAVSATEAALIASNYLRHGEFWPDGIKGSMEAVEATMDPDEYNAILDGEESGPAVYVNEEDHIMPELTRKQAEQARVQEAREAAEHLNKQYKAPVQPMPVPVSPSVPFREYYAGPAD